jgi:hypothetical protein
LIIVKSYVKPMPLKHGQINGVYFNPIIKKCGIKRNVEVNHRTCQDEKENPGTELRAGTG